MGPFGMGALCTTGCSFFPLYLLHAKLLAIPMLTVVRPQQERLNARKGSGAEVRMAAGNGGGRY